MYFLVMKMRSSRNILPLLSTMIQRTCKFSALPELTKDRYPNVKRGNYSQIDTKHLNFFKDLLGETRVITDENECLGYNTDWIKANRGYSRCVLKPKSTDEVAAILKFCNENLLAVCPQGGNTGLVGGSVPVFDEIVLSTSLMNRIISLDETSGVLTCEAGCILENLEKYLDEHRLIMPLDLGAKGSCQIGGNVSTNAGGLRLLRYGNLQGTVLGLEAVTANGQILDCMSTLKKDNTGFHLKHLFIGSEGSLGLVTKVSIQCPPKPKAVNLAFLGLESFDKILMVFKRCKHELGEILSSCEAIDADSLAATTDNLNLKSPLEKFPFYMVIETHGSDNGHDEEKLNRFLSSLMEDGTVEDGIATNEPSKMNAVWQLRERITEGLIHDGYVFKYDLSLPLENFYSLVGIMKERVGKDAVRVSGYGHVGDGNVHLNVAVKEFSADVLNKIEPFIYEYTSKLRGSISAEHGIGFRKTKYMHYSKSKEAIDLMKSIKKMMDPKGILNPYKVLPQ
ncbi:D-2-hydroxyglutarate dehydrogenase, mitochondrial [Coccinella septempunctata]|uniref:D-2-hydroxyglutarate dehydrogenase, mitochondrial n=1 Tax=Coccinella septempunctata TaxID=41139 RepID=UPI001D07102C|nr:D-2-hydroxyglutarate dehydrogenase, mitochondrial [Coccinella septempunctata]XP_044751510.1 D-2-hydroxyglutarate dehydrogenase, mitochondrial [Coccinella septempunctata]XP_044751511.1 D-2-hydroxyglutarate dehydrogenase, mitochondrial [Coccinella septempunctata]XP_044751512.1 D-2-hydroxyglutarate dehydrogenase, mitochondrial [Coccinella septempunctata]XP_044751513.1 D-2-hydroxyglutarate dehydrogenase, mitochondrial [Coccinella septempunctata]